MAPAFVGDTMPGSWGATYGWRARRSSSAAILPGVRMKSTALAAIAASGMPSYLALDGSWAKVMPPSALMAASPSVPSEAAPDRTMPMARLPRVLANDRKKPSIGMGGRCR